ncbi:MAG: hypothetical protein ACKOPT_09070 [Cyanobium sp.]
MYRSSNAATTAGAILNFSSNANRASRTPQPTAPTTGELETRR